MTMRDVVPTSADGYYSRTCVVMLSWHRDAGLSLYSMLQPMSFQ